ncbi:MAG: cell division protein ZapA [Firmicutes bacterium]|nr:cell division protein ZapA [Bacillota bacterium]
MSQRPKSREVHSVRVRIADDEYNIRGKGSPEYIRRLAQIVNEYFVPVTERFPNLPRNRAGVLALMNMANDLEKQRQENRELMELVAEIEK